MSFPSLNKNTALLAKINGEQDGADAAKEGDGSRFRRENGWANLCAEVGLDRFAEPILRNAYEDGFLEGFLREKK